MEDEKTDTEVTEQLPLTEDFTKREEFCNPLQPPAYESLPQYHANAIPLPAPPYPGLDVELPNYCEVATARVTGVVLTQPRRYTEPSSGGRIIDGIETYLPYIVLIGCSVVSILLCFPIGLCALGFSISAIQHRKLYKERSTHMRTAIGCILLATAVGVPIHIVFWKHIA